MGKINVSKMNKAQLKELLVQVTEEIQEVTGMDPELKTSLSAAKMEEQIKQAYELLEEDDEMSETALALFEYLGLSSEDEDEEEEDEEEEDEDDDADEKEDEDDEDEEEEKPASKKKSPPPAPVKNKSKSKAKDEDEEEEDEDEEEEDEDEEEDEKPKKAAAPKYEPVPAKRAKQLLKQITGSNLKTLKAVVNAEPEFAGIIPNLASYSNKSGLSDFLIAIIEGRAAAPAIKSKKDKKEDAKGGAKGKPAVQKAEGKKGKGIIQTIVDCIENANKKKGISKDEILAVLIKDFPDRDADSMKRTIHVQVPSRISKEKFEVGKTKDGNYYKASDEPAE